MALALLAGCAEDLVIEPRGLPAGRLGSPYRQPLTFPNAGTPLAGVEHSGELPDGLRLVFRKSEQQARVEGTPRLPGSFDFTVTAWCESAGESAGRSGKRKYTLVVEPR